VGKDASEQFNQVELPAHVGIVDVAVEDALALDGGDLPADDFVADIEHLLLVLDQFRALLG